VVPPFVGTRGCFMRYIGHSGFPGYERFQRDRTGSISSEKVPGLIR
jgi:hypothetical protein